MKKLSLVAALAAIAVAVPLGIGSSHREAPLTSIDPTADDTDVYAFTAKNDPSTDQNEEKYLTVVANWIPFEDPAGGPNFYRFDDKRPVLHQPRQQRGWQARHQVPVQVQDQVRQPELVPVRRPDGDSIDDPDLNVKQTYTVERLVYDHASARATQAKSRQEPWQEQSQASTGASEAHAVVRRSTPSRWRGTSRSRPTTSARRRSPTTTRSPRRRSRPSRTAHGCSRASATTRSSSTSGRRSTPSTCASFRATRVAEVDDLAGYSTHSVVLQVPERRLTRDREPVSGDDDRNGVVGVWASAERRKLQVTDSDEDGKGDFTQVSRLGNPLVNEVVIPLGQKDRFNRTQPADDATNFGKFVVEPELAKLMNALFGLGVKETDRSDIVLALLQGIPGLNQHQGSKGGTPVDTIKLNLGTPPAATENPLGVIGGDTAGFPNGRRLGDDVVDISLRVVAGILLSPPEQVTVPLGDGVPQNEKPFSNSFPYVASPDSGFNSKLKKQY